MSIHLITRNSDKHATRDNLARINRRLSDDQGNHLRAGMSQGFNYIGKGRHRFSLSIQLAADVVGWDVHQHHQLFNDIMKDG